MKPIESKASFDALEEQFSHDGKQATRDRLRERRDELLRDDPFAPRETIFHLLKLENAGLEQPLSVPEISEICRGATYKRALVSKEDTREFLKGRASRRYSDGKNEGEIRSLLTQLNRESCEEEVSQEVIDGIVSEVLRGSTKSDRFTRTLLGDAMRNGVPEPEEFEQDVLIKGDVHQIFTGPGDGKSWLALYLAKNAVGRGQSVVYFAMENGPRIAEERLEALGADPEKVDEHLHYFYGPDVDMSRDALGAYVALLD